MSFQNQVNANQAPAKVGDRASMNSVQVVDAGPGNLTAGTGGVTVGRFAWNTYVSGAGTALNNASGVPVVPDGFIANEQQALITVYLGETSLVVPAGLGVTEYDRGDFWAKSTYSEAVIGNKVFANVFSGECLAAATGAFPTNDSGSATSVTATGTVGTYSINISAIAAGVVAVGQKISGTYIAAETYIESQADSSTGSTGNYNLSRPLLGSFTSGTLALVSPEGNGGGVVSASANTGSPTLTINSVTTGHVYAGMLVSGTSIPSGTYISALGTFTNAAGTGTVTLSANTTGTISSASIKTSSWIETPWTVKSAANVGELMKIGIKN